MATIEKDLGAVSAYAIAVENGFEGTVEEWLKSLIGPMGYQGWSVSAVRATTTGQLIFTITNPETGETKELDPVQADTVDALQEIKAALDDAKKQVGDTANTAATSAVKTIESAQNAGTQAVGDAKTAAVEAVTSAQTAGVQAVQGAQTTAINEITEAKTQATEAVGTAKTQAVQAVEDAENTGVSAVEDAKSNALTEVGEVKTTAVDAVNAAGTQATSAAKTAITGAKNQAVSDVQTVGQAAVSSVGDAQTEAVEAVETSQTNAVQAVQDAGADEVEKINGILPAPTEADAGKVPVAKPDGSGYDLGSQIDDGKTSLDTTWSSENIVSRICPPFELSGSIVTCQPVEGSTLNTVVQIEPVQEGTGDPSPENVRPIKGWESLTLNQNGKNLASREFTKKIVDAGERFGYLTPILPAGNYSWFAEYSSEDTNALYIYIMVFYQDGTRSQNSYITTTSGSINRNGTINISKNGRLFIYSASSAIGENEQASKENLAKVNLQIEPGTEYPTSYEPYRGETFTISLGQTVYGGTLNVGSGVLTIIDKLSDLPEIPESANNGILEFTNVVRFNLRLKLIFTDANSDTYPGISSHFPYNVNYSQDTPHWYIGSSSLLLFINKSELGSYDISGLNAWVSKYSPVQFVYRLANPVTVQLTPQEILALSGENTVYADTGNVTVSGYSDPTAIINSLADRIAALEHNAIGG